MHAAASESDEVHLPADAFERLGSEVELTVGPGDIVTLRRRRRRIADIVAETGARAVDDPSQLRHSLTPLSEAERGALKAFLAE